MTDVDLIIDSDPIPSAADHAPRKYTKRDGPPRRRAKRRPKKITPPIDAALAVADKLPPLHRAVLGHFLENGRNPEEAVLAAIKDAPDGFGLQGSLNNHRISWRDVWEHVYHDDEARKVLEQRAKDSVHIAALRARLKAGNAIDAIAAIQEDDKAPPAVRVSAADRILSVSGTDQVYGPKTVPNAAIQIVFSGNVAVPPDRATVLTMLTSSPVGGRLPPTADENPADPQGPAGGTP